MNDWNGNGRYDSQDRHIDYKGATSGYSGGGGGSDILLGFILLALMTVCPPLGIVILILCMILG